MANNTLVKALLGLLVVVVVACLGLMASYNFTLLKYRRLQSQVVMASNLQAQMNQLAAALGGELIEYSKKNPSIDPLLRQYGFKAPQTNAAPVAPQR